jgi:hypothetical protein
MIVMNDLMADINWSAKFIQGALDDLDRTVHTGAKSPRLGQ